ncbi:MAG TPA: penicillin-binding protein 2 [Gemmatimonadaceae bacterium]|jgi:penicillin-binding protein 2|nr:penicillin-binding protein 2 [Gemmatimonadaceae bacterium]
MSFHPNDVIRRGRAASIIVSGVLVFLLSAFFRAQVIRNQESLLQSEENRLRQIPTAAPRGRILDRNNKPIAENVVGYSVALLAQREDTLKATLDRLRTAINLTPKQYQDAIRRFHRDPTRPTVIIQDASLDIVSVLEEHHMDFPSLIIQSAPKRIYPNGTAVGALVGYISEISEGELANLASAGYKPGQLIGKRGLEKQYEQELRGREGVQFVEVDAKNRVVSTGRARDAITPQEGPPLYTNIDLDLQEYMHSLFGDSLAAGAIAMNPKTGEVLALYSSPSIDPNRFVGGVPASYYDSLRNDPRLPEYNKVTQATQPPGSTFKLATSVMALEDSLITFDSHMPQSCNGFYYFGNRAWRCWRKEGHGSLNLFGAIAQSCDVYFYQLGQRLTLSRLVAGGLSLGFEKKSGIDLPEENRPKFPTSVPEYFNQLHGPRGWTPGATELNMAIGQGENAQTVVNMARFYSALATDGTEPTPIIKKGTPKLSKRITLSPEQIAQLRKAMMGVVSEGGTAAGAAIKGVKVAGKTGTAQTMRNDKNGKPLYWAWFAGMAPAEDPQIVVVVMVPNVTFEGATSAGFATKIIAHYLHTQITNTIENTG